MRELAFRYDPKKATEAILFLANRAKWPTLHKITHLLYFADKTSLERYGRFICGDDYFAMKHGPVPSHTYDMLKEAEWRLNPDFKIDGAAVIALRQPDLDELSDSDIECLDRAIDLYGDAPFEKIKRASHDKAYQGAWDSRGSKNSTRIPIEGIAKLLQNSDKLIHFLENRHSD